LPLNTRWYVSSPRRMIDLNEYIVRGAFCNLNVDISFGFNYVGTFWLHTFYDGLNTYLIVCHIRPEVLLFPVCQTCNIHFFTFKMLLQHCWLQSFMIGPIILPPNTNAAVACLLTVNESVVFCNWTGHTYRWFPARRSDEIWPDGEHHILDTLCWKNEDFLSN